MMLRWIKKNSQLITIGMLIMIGFILTSLVSYFVSRASLRTQIMADQLPLTSDNIYSEIQRDLLRPIFISSLMATDAFLRDWVINGEKDVRKVTRYLKEIQNKYNTVTSFFVSERTRIYYHANGILKKVSPNEPRDVWYFRVRKMSPDYEINIDPDMAGKDMMTIFVNYRVFDYHGKYIGATGVGITLSAATKFIETYQKRYDRKIFFVDEKGKIRLHGTNFSETAGSIFQMEGISDIASEILAGKKKRFLFKRNGTITHLNTRFIPEFGWYLMVEQTEEKAVRQIARALVINLIICAVITVAVVSLIKISIALYQRKLEKMATEDKLTGAYNRHAFDVIYGQTFKEARRKEMLFSLILYDIDDFKRINDRYGHLAGDEVLKSIVALARTCIRESDTLCRWGGEEFLVLLKDCNLYNALGTAEKIRTAIKGKPFFYQDKTITATVSLGVAQYREADNEDALLKRVDEALLKAKAKGKDRSERESIVVHRS